MIVENMSRQQYIDWLIAEKGYTYDKAVEMADFMGVTE